MRSRPRPSADPSRPRRLGRRDDRRSGPSPVRTSTWSLDGRPPALPRPLDRASERWWASRPRTRALVTALAVVGVVGGTAARLVGSPYGPPTRVVVTARDLPAGHRPTTSDLVTRTWPASLVPVGAIAPGGAGSSATGRLAGPLPAGTVLTDLHLARGGPAAAMPPGAAAVAVPRDLLPAVAPGARIDVVAVAGDGSGVVVARDAVVLAVADGTVWLEVDRADAAAVAAATLRGTVGVALLPDAERP